MGVYFVEMGFIVASIPAGQNVVDTENAAGVPKIPCPRWIRKLHISRRAKILSTLSGPRFQRQIESAIQDESCN